MAFFPPGPARIRRLGPRGIALVAIGALHAAAVAGLLQMGIRPAEPVVATPIQAVLLQAADQPQQARPKLEVQMELPQVQIPPVYIEPFQMPAQPTAIRVSPDRAAPAQIAASVTPVDADIPVELERIDYLERVEPRYPPAARRARAQGTVFLRVIIGTDGRPRDVRVERSSGHELLDAAACSAVQKWLFRPYRENGIARAASVIVPLKFEISTRRG
jgi:protein TonB